jgi:hypothetical protein
VLGRRIGLARDEGLTMIRLEMTVLCDICGMSQPLGHTGSLRVGLGIARYRHGWGVVTDGGLQRHLCPACAHRHRYARALAVFAREEAQRDLLNDPSNSEERA